jgi:hypothetical protein
VNFGISTDIETGPNGNLFVVADPGAVSRSTEITSTFQPATFNRLRRLNHEKTTILFAVILARQ